MVWLEAWIVLSFVGLFLYFSEVCRQEADYQRLREKGRRAIERARREKDGA